MKRSNNRNPEGDPKDLFTHSPPLSRNACRWCPQGDTRLRHLTFNLIETIPFSFIGRTNPYGLDVFHGM